MVVGCCVEGWTITVGSGPGRANSKINIEFVGSGKLTEPSGITVPAITLEKLLPSASLTLTINGVDYVTNKNIVSLETAWKNNIRMDAGFYPGSGFQTTGDATTGTAVIHLQFDTNNSLDITWQKVAFATAEVGETDQIVTVAVEATPIYDTTNGIITAVAKCNVDAICQ